jgi:hypothetical protein
MIDKGFKKWKRKLNRSSMTLTAIKDFVFSSAGHIMKLTYTILAKSPIKAILNLKKVKESRTTGLKIKKIWENVNGL